MMQLSDHLSLSEFTASDTAERLRIDNGLPLHLQAEAHRTAAMFERVRAKLAEIHGADTPILVTSGYRCPYLNRAVGGALNSDHVRAMALDIKVPVFGSPRDVCLALRPHLDALGVGQMIYEFTWVHLSTRRPMMDVNRVLTLSRGGGYIQGVA